MEAYAKPDVQSFRQISIIPTPRGTEKNRRVKAKFLKISLGTFREASGECS